MDISFQLIRVNTKEQFCKKLDKVSSKVTVPFFIPTSIEYILVAYILLLILVSIWCFQLFGS